MSLHHTWNNSGLENKPDNNQQQFSPNQGSNFNVGPQQYQQNGPQQYQQQSVASAPQQYAPQQNLMQQPPQSVGPQQYAPPQQQSVVAPQQYQQNGPQQYQQQSVASAPQQYAQPQQQPQSTGAQQYQQPQQQYQQQPMMNQQRPNFVSTGQQNPQGVNSMPNNVQQASVPPIQNQTLAERIANLQSGGLNQNENYYAQKNIKPADLLNVPIDPNIKVGLGKNMNIAASLPTDLFEDEDGKQNRKKNRKLNTDVEIDGVQCQCKNCVKKSRPWLTVLVSVLIMLVILGGIAGSIYGFRAEIKDWLLATELTVNQSVGASLLTDDKTLSPTTYYLSS